MSGGVDACRQAGDDRDPADTSAVDTSDAHSKLCLEARRDPTTDTAGSLGCSVPRLKSMGGTW